jgi:hypothetical protein
MKKAFAVDDVDIGTALQHFFNYLFARQSGTAAARKYGNHVTATVSVLFKGLKEANSAVVVAKP